LAAPVFAGPDIIQKNDNDQSVNVGGDDSLGFGFGFAMGAPSPGDCYSSKQGNVIVVSWQTNEENPWCMALYADSIGQHHTAAMLRCSIEALSRLFASIDDCVAGWTVVAPKENIAEKVSDTVNNLVKRQDAITEPLREDIQNLYLEVQKLEQQRRQPVVRPQQTIVQPFLDDKKREALAAIRGDE
jgi:hypothetical protein